MADVDSGGGPLVPPITLYIVGAIVMSLMTVAAVVAVAIFRPDSPITTTITSIMVPVTMALLAAGLQGVHKGVNGLVSRIVDQTAQSSRALGRADAIRQLWFKLATLTPGTPEHDTLAEQIRKESLSYFEVVEK